MSVKKCFLIPATCCEVCFECGKIRIAGIMIDNLPFFPCLEEKCPYEERRLCIGKHKIFNEIYETYIRKVKKTCT